MDDTEVRTMRFSYGITDLLKIQEEKYFYSDSIQVVEIPLLEKRAVAHSAEVVRSANPTNQIGVLYVDRNDRIPLIEEVCSQLLSQAI